MQTFDTHIYVTVVCFLDQVTVSYKQAHLFVLMYYALLFAPRFVYIMEHVVFVYNDIGKHKRDRADYKCGRHFGCFICY